MIITKTPFRISFAGGGSDIEDFYKQYGGCVLSTTINKYIYISVHPYFDKKLTALKYSENEIVCEYSEIKHRILRTVLEDMNLKGLELVSTADIPSGTGLGSSSAFTVGVLNALNSYQGKALPKGIVAEKACEIEIDKLGAPIGKQDQYAAAFGGLNFITFHRNGEVQVEPIVVNLEVSKKLQDNLVLLYTGIRHNANEILAEQKKQISSADKTANLLRMCELARDMRYSLEQGSLDSFGQILDEGWRRKRELAQSISGDYLDELYECAIKNGAVGGKLLGAGGGGFFLFYCEKEKQPLLKSVLGLEEFPFRFENGGTRVIYYGS